MRKNILNIASAIILLTSCNTLTKSDMFKKNVETYLSKAFPDANIEIIGLMKSDSISYRKNMINKYSHSGKEVEAIQYNGDNGTEIMLFVGKELQKSAPPRHMEFSHDIPHSCYTIEIPTAMGNIDCARQNYVVKDSENNFHVCDINFFRSFFKKN